jgi:DNA-binding IclR family transcriptional regulator
MEESKSGGVQSVVRALAVIEILDIHGELGINEMSSLLSLEPSTVHRLVSTLRAQKYVLQNPGNRKYQNGFRIFEIGSNVVRRLGIRRQAYPFMTDLAARTKEAVNLAVRDGDRVVYIDKIESQATIKVDLPVGKAMPLYCTGLGKVLLAALPEQEVRCLLGEGPFERFTEKTVTDPGVLRLQLDRIRSLGFCVDNEEYVSGLICIAAPVRGRNGEVIAALSVAVPKYRYDEDPEKKDLFREFVVSAALGLSESLGYGS